MLHGGKKYLKCVVFIIYNDLKLEVDIVCDFIKS